MINWQLSKQGIRWPVSPDRTAGSSVDPSRSSIFLKLSADKLQVSNDRRLKFIFFQWFIWNMLCLCHYGPALLRFWFQTDLVRENSASFLTILAEKTFSWHGHALRPILCSYWSKFDRWVHAENLCCILKVVYFDSLSWQSFVSTCDVFNCLFSTECTKWNTAAMKSLLLFVAGLCFWFLVEKCVACQNSIIRFRMSSFSFFTLLNA